jgi:hypothetical protein
LVDVVNCMDTERSKSGCYWDGNDGLANFADDSDVIVAPAIDAKRAGDQHIFRVKGWHLPIIVSDAVKSMFERSHVSGVTFRPV